jgi:hypothetical protein
VSPEGGTAIRVLRHRHRDSTDHAFKNVLAKMPRIRLDMARQAHRLDAIGA